MSIFKNILLITTLLLLSVVLTTSYAQTPLNLAATQMADNHTFRNGELSAANANRSAARTSQVGTSIQNHEQLLSDGRDNVNHSIDSLTVATGLYRAVNNRFLR